MEKILVISPDGLSLTWDLEAKMWMGIARNPETLEEYASLEVNYLNPVHGDTVRELVREEAKRKKLPTVHILRKSVELSDVGPVFQVSDRFGYWVNKLEPNPEVRSRVAPIIENLRQFRIITMCEITSGGFDPFLRRYRRTGYFRLRIGSVGSERGTSIPMRTFSDQIPRIQ